MIAVTLALACWFVSAGGEGSLRVVRVCSSSERHVGYCFNKQ